MPQHSHDDICRRISLNLPASAQWSWDYTYDIALVVIDKRHMDLVYLPITLEFDNQWDFTTIENSPPAFYIYINRVFGIVPGQKIFTSTGATGTILFAVWWPWGNEQKISLRVGLYDSTDVVTDQDQLREALKSWFRIKDKPLADQLANHLGVRPEQLPHFKEVVIPRLKNYTKTMCRKKVRQNDADADSATYNQFIIDNVFIDEFENHPYIRSVTDEDNRTILLPGAKDVATQMISAWRSEVVTEEKCK